MVQTITTQSVQESLTGLTSSQELPESEIISSTEVEDPLSEFIDTEQFSMAVHYHVNFYHTTVMEAIMVISERIGLELAHDTDRIKELLDEPLKQQLYLESVRANLVRGEIFTQLDV